jgi:hypothetical protein
VENVFESVLASLSNNTILTGCQIDSYIEILNQISQMRNDKSFLFVSYLFLGILVSKGFEAAFAFLKTDPSLYDFVIFPFNNEGVWQLIVVSKYEKDKISNRKIICYDHLVSLQAHPIIRKVICFYHFISNLDSLVNEKAPNKIPFIIMRCKKVCFGSEFSDIFICQIAKSIVFGKEEILHYVSLPIEKLRKSMITEVRLVKNKGVEFLARNYYGNEML